MAPLAFNVTGKPEHKVVNVGVTATVGTGLAFTATVATPEQVPSVATTV